MTFSEKVTDNLVTEIVIISEKTMFHLQDERRQQMISKIKVCNHYLSFLLAYTQKVLTFDICVTEFVLIAVLAISSNFCRDIAEMKFK